MCEISDNKYEIVKTFAIKPKYFNFDLHSNEAKVKKAYTILGKFTPRYFLNDQPKQGLNILRQISYKNYA